VLQGLAQRLKISHPGYEMTPRELIDATLKLSGHGDIAGLEADMWRDLQPDFRTSHYLDGFAHADRKFHFQADPFRLATSPSRGFLNTTFNETPGSQVREGRASVMIHPLDAAALDIAD